VAKRIAQLDYFAAATQALKTSLSLATADAVGQAPGEDGEEPNAQQT
jgi:hypothetical protein